MVPLSSFQQSSSMLGDDPEAFAVLQQEAGDAVARIDRRVRQMSLLAESDPPTRKPIPLDTLIQKGYETAFTRCHSPTAELRRRGPPEAFAQQVLGHFDNLQQALAEIFLNALESMSGEGKIEVTVESEMTTQTAPELIRILIRDEGKGFSTEAAKRAFEPFFSERAVGLGIGLTVAQRVIELHEGSIEIVISAVASRGAVQVLLPAASSH